MNKTVDFRFGREHYVGDVRYVEGSQARVSPGLAAALEKQGVGRVLQDAKASGKYAKAGKSGKTRTDGGNSDSRA